jgi:hypothetical protein
MLGENGIEYSRKTPLISQFTSWHIQNLWPKKFNRLFYYEKALIIITNDNAIFKTFDVIFKMKKKVYVLYKCFWVLYIH